MTQSDNYIVIGEFSGEFPDSVSCGGGYCLSFTGVVPSSIEMRPLGHGVPIPSRWMVVRRDLVEGVVIPSDPDAAMLRIAIHLASRGVYFSPDSTVLPHASVKWSIEFSRIGGRILYHNSMWLMDAVSRDSVSMSISTDGFRPMVVSGNISWATKAVFDGYVGALSGFGIDVVAFEYDGFMKMFSEDMVRKILLAELCNVENRITHVIVIDGMSVPSWVIDSAKRSGIVTIMVSTEDPHCIDVTRRLHPNYDYVFSNDRNAAEMFGVHYLPVAGDSRCSISEKDIDVLFVGAIYPNRSAFLSGIVESCVDEGMSVRIIGPLYKCRASGALSSVIDTRMVSTNEYLNLLSRSKICINMFRDEYCGVTGFNSELRIPAYSMSPRCYDAPLCDSFLMTDRRDEVVEVLGQECIFGDRPHEDVVDAVKKYESKKGIIERQRKNLQRGHLYAHRATCLLSAIGKGFLG